MAATAKKATARKRPPAAHKGAKRTRSAGGKRA